MKPVYLFVIATIILIISCRNTQKDKPSENKYTGEAESKFTKGEYGYDRVFLQKYLKTVELINGDSRLLVIPEYQGRVMTTSSSGVHGISNGWINYDLIASSESKENFNPFGGEERIWLGPEGGQFSLYFGKGASFQNGKWVVPAPFDREPFSIENEDANSVTLYRNIKLENYSGTCFSTKITRKVTLLNKNQISELLGIRYGKSVKTVAFQSENRLKNTGIMAWDKENGALSIWMLTMFNASPDVTVILPYRKGDYGRIVKDDYLVKVPEERLKIAENAVYFKTDGKFRSKIGISPQRALPYIGSYDRKNKILTILEFSLPPNITEYVNSSLEIQENPFNGDVINSYNDGPGKDGSQMGLYYELETSSPAAFLKPGEEIIHMQRIFHFEGNENDLNVLCETILKVSLEETEKAFNN
jgi:hypothetical protein